MENKKGNNKNMNITYLGPEGATFSAIAYDKLAELYGAPKTTSAGVTLTLANNNSDVLPLLLRNGGYGVIAMETRAEGKVDPPVNSFIELVRKYDVSCPIQVLGALGMKIGFALMAKKGTQISDLRKIIAHPKAIGACRENIHKLGVEVVEATSNGKAAHEVSITPESAADEASDVPANTVAAIGPIQAAEKYGLEVLVESFEEKPAVTTFYLLGPQALASGAAGHAPKTQVQRCLTVFRVKHQPGALVKVLTPFADEGINLRLIHSLHLENGIYDFAIETESDEKEAGNLAAHKKALASAQNDMGRWIHFGPFPVTFE